MYIETKQAMALRKHGAALLRSLAVKEPIDFAPHTLEWSEINKRQASMLTTARSFLDRIQTDTPEATALELEAAHEAVMVLWDAAEREKDMRSKLGSRAPRSTGDDARRPGYGEDLECDENRSDRGDLNAHVLPGLGPQQRVADFLGERRGRQEDGALQQLGAGQYLRSMVLGAHTDLERRALAEGTDSAGGYTVPEVIAAELIDRMRANAVVIRAGARTIPITSDHMSMAKVLTDPVPSWRAENAGVATGEPTFGKVAFAPKSLAVLVLVSRELLEDSVNINQALPEVLAKAMATEVDRVALLGSGAGSEPKGVASFAGIGTYVLSGTPTSGSLVKARTLVTTSNAPPPTAYVMHPREEGGIAQLLDGQGQPLRLPSVVEATPFLTTTAIPINGGTGTNEGTIFTGYFPHLMIGVRSELRIEILRERFADNMQYGFLAHMRVDVAALYESSFAQITKVKPVP